MPCCREAARRGQRQGCQPAAGQPVRQEPALGHPVTWPLQLSAHARQPEECDPDGSLRPHQVAQLSLPKIAQE